jgi:hypothetical protein
MTRWDSFVKSESFDGLATPLVVRRHSVLVRLQVE